MTTLRAHFDGRQIRLEDDYPLTKDAKLLVTVLQEGDDLAQERADWLRHSARNLDRAYSPAEPDYTAAMVKEPNPGYDGR